MDFLVLTVGGAHQPLLTSIETLKPDRVYFLCSDDGQSKGSYTQVIGEGMVLKSPDAENKCDLPNIVAMAKLRSDQYHVEKIADFDDLSKCYLSASRLISQIHRSFPEARVIADYTGGTKSMSAGLASAALDDEKCDIVLVTGARRDLVKVVDRTQIVRQVVTHDIRIERGLDEARRLLSRFDYEGARELLEALAARYAGVNTIHKLQRGITLCRAFEAWDRFEHKTALLLLEIHAAEFVPYVIFLKAIVNQKGHGYEMVEDLVWNAERRAYQERYDDAVARLYRTVEMLAQKRLKKRGICTSKVDMTKFNDDDLARRFEKRRNEKGIVKIGLKDDWDLLAVLEDEPLAKHYEAVRGKLLGFLELRNNSILAHGIEPVKKSEYYKERDWVVDFVFDGVEKAVAFEGKVKLYSKPSQLPVDFL